LKAGRKPAVKRVQTESSEEAAGFVQPRGREGRFVNLDGSGHWGTFKLADEPLDEPPRRLEAEGRRLALDPARVRVLAVGESAEVRRA
jgi:hypothetical protein